MHLELKFLITLQAQIVKLSPPSPLPPHFFAQELCMFLFWNLELLNLHPESNIQRMLFCSEMSAHSLTKYYIAGFWSVIMKMSVLLKNTLKFFLVLSPNLWSNTILRSFVTRYISHYCVVLLYDVIPKLLV